MNTVPTVPVPGESHPHYDLITGLLAFAGFLTDHPQLPVEDAGQQLHVVLDLPLGASDSDQIAYVRRVARILDVDPYWFGGEEHFYATREFSPRVVVEARAVLKKAMDEHFHQVELGRQALEAEKAAAAQAAETVVVVDEPAAGPAEGGRDTAECHACQFCSGSGMEGNGTCPHCLGAGRPLSMADLEPPQADTQPCPDCRGSGALEQEGGGCRSCWGSGRVLTGPPDCALCGGTGRGFDEFGLECNLPCGACHGTGYQPVAVRAW